MLHLSTLMALHFVQLFMTIPSIESCSTTGIPYVCQIINFVHVIVRMIPVKF